MNFCKECGNQLPAGSGFCKNCGTPYKGQEPTPDPAEPIGTRSSEKSKRPNKPLILSVAALVLLLIAGFTAYKLIEGKTGPTATVKNFKQAIENKDTEAVKGYVNEGQSEIEADDKTVKDFIEYASKNNAFSSAIDSLEKQANGMDGGELARPITDDHDNEWLQLKRDGKQWLFFDHYVVEVKPVTVKVTSNFEDSSVYLDGKKKGILDKEDGIVKAGEILPGSHNVKVEYKGEYATLSDNVDVDVSEAEKNLLEVEVPLEGKYVYISSNYGDANLFVNGKDTGKTIDDIDKFGPVATDGSITLHAEKNFDVGKMKSESVVVKSDEDVSLDIDYDESAMAAGDETMDDDSGFYKDEVKNFMSEYVKLSVEAMNTHDFSLISDYLDESGDAYDETSKYIDYVNEKGITEKLVDYEVIDVEQFDEEMIHVSAYETFDITYGDGETKRKKFKSRYAVYAPYDGGYYINKLLETKEVK
ncbi:zinc ribbon domain-containing protein [Fictibacillus sp. KU28468]|uniref:zinc ribbon domain-containing protein n=1 Tax=Fictibacillus sp. KU28468 TaxID=2991053 RepID=UPI00223D88FB|nr:PEGA domain-containing protein [Fictibacillus sp. KU28468]UZJ79552.1 PEGA domain-containing protein [Fictibacillus sp. KU28468]